MDAYERVLTDAMAGDATLFARRDYVEEAWPVVDPVLKAGTPDFEYEPQTWGPKEVERLTPPGGWRDPVVSRQGDPRMETRILADTEAVAREAAKVIAAEARAAVAARGRFIVAVSGGRTPWRMLRLLAGEDLPWKGVHVVQVDERVAPAGDPDRNLTHLRESLGSAPLTEDHLHAMPVEQADLEAGARSYARTLEQIGGTPPRIDLVHLGLGPDGHTASLVPDDPVLNVVDKDVAITGVYRKRRRMTLTYPILNRSRRVLWLVTGADKAAMLLRLRAADASIPAGRVSQEQALVLADRSANGENS